MLIWGVECRKGEFNRKRSEWKEKRRTCRCQMSTLCGPSPVPGEDLVSAGTRLYVIKKFLLKNDHILAIKASARFLMLRQAVKVWLQVRIQVVQIDCTQGTQENSP
jgi:hypothetical protein